jgi:xanthine dehydrogenase accessory factor
MEQGEQTILATAIRTTGAPPCTVGQKMILGSGGPIEGTLGCSDFDTAAAREAADILAGGRAVLRTYHHDLGSVEVYLEPYAQRPRLVVVGATPISLWLLRWGRDLGYDTILVEDRPDWITPEHREAAGAVVESTKTIAGGSEIDVVHADHESPTVPQQIAGVMSRNPRFVGIIGSARHTGHHLEQLRAIGMPESDIARIQSPVGLNLGAKTPPEIALSILAGLMRHRTGRPGSWLDPRYNRDGGASSPPTQEREAVAASGKGGGHEG